MRSTGIMTLTATVLSFAPVSPSVLAQTREEGPWWPHPIWGAEDQGGASNWITPAKILEAVRLVEAGQVYELGYPYQRGMPLLGQRSYASFLAPGRASSEGELVFNDDFLAAEIGQVGTQFDGLGHAGQRLRMADGTLADVFYNGVTLEEMRSPFGLLKLGVENTKPFITPGILIDLAAYKGVQSLPNGYDVTVADVQGALMAQGLTENDIRPGDAILFNLGWSNLWADPDRVANDWRARPGVDPEVYDWIVERRPSVVGWDTGADGTGHAVLTTRNGIGSIEFMNLGELTADRVYRFMFLFAPIRFSGATGSPGRPLAIR